MITRRVALVLLALPLSREARPLGLDVLRGDPDRRLLLDAIRPTLARATNGPIRFTVRELRRFGDFAYGVLQPRRPDGEGAIDWMATPYRARAEGAGFEDGLTYVLWRRLAGGWKVEEQAVGPAAPVWPDWQRRYRLPRNLFEQGGTP
ncbi:hypothetical protein [Roseococcus pinisoli]|uniref:DUF4864 domain-containing protein n=1 Tax=Roseococcus pinisoli TaxID=2835040 RepID=A0ABS5QAJ5_9PROT|nr:hypothetical protein [Roseococcus pinisoli]MBS7810685.1 hypothetical protein [Roseococcus pinisoli]